MFWLGWRLKGHTRNRMQQIHKSPRHSTAYGHNMNKTWTSRTTPQHILYKTYHQHSTTNTGTKHTFHRYISTTKHSECWSCHVLCSVTVTKSRVICRLCVLLLKVIMLSSGFELVVSDWGISHDNPQSWRTLPAKAWSQMCSSNPFRLHTAQLGRLWNVSCSHCCS